MHHKHQWNMRRPPMSIMHVARPCCSVFEWGTWAIKISPNTFQQNNNVNAVYDYNFSEQTHTQKKPDLKIYLKSCVPPHILQYLCACEFHVNTFSVGMHNKTWLIMWCAYFSLFLHSQFHFCLALFLTCYPSDPPKSWYRRTHYWMHVNILKGGPPNRMIVKPLRVVLGCVYHHFSGVELRFPNDFRWFLQMINAKLFWNAEKVWSDTRLSQKHVSVEMINAKLFWNAFISLTDLRKNMCLTWSLLYGSNCAMQLRSDKAFLSTRTRDRVRW